MNKILTIDKGRVVVNEVVLGVPEFETLYNDFIEKYGEDVANNAFKYLHFMYEEESPYFNIKEDEREDAIKADFGKGFKPSHELSFINAERKMQKLCNGPVHRFLSSLRISMDKISDYLSNTEVIGGKDGNFGEIIAAHQKGKEVIKNYNSVESDFKNEIAKKKGDTKKAIDAGETTDDF